ncbi:hypothetical protein B0T10DRAFT_270918 [Thelonectria olida]|uniref:Uncharacterized protein n=1 Tax=Thelonectria olida TaxID=1576542 RepID=A0A9P9ARU5_9HYPO|nr:hypothetical protein B0T10DRAFT_270918 [Thelonectria olida]
MFVLCRCRCHDVACVSCHACFVPLISACPLVCLLDFPAGAHVVSSVVVFPWLTRCLTLLLSVPYVIPSLASLVIRVGRRWHLRWATHFALSGHVRGASERERGRKERGRDNGSRLKEKTGRQVSVNCQVLDSWQQLTMLVAQARRIARVLVFAPLLLLLCCFALPTRPPFNKPFVTVITIAGLHHPNPKRRRLFIAATISSKPFPLLPFVFVYQLHMPDCRTTTKRTTNFSRLHI